jgi:hypothetical protein
MIDDIFRKLIKELNISLFVETGTDMGETVAAVAEWFSEMDVAFGRISGYTTTGSRSYSIKSEIIKYPIFENAGNTRFKIFSADIDPCSFRTACKLFETNPNIQLFCENSPEFLKGLIDAGNFEKADAMFFLDAHWGRYWPLRDELKQITRLKKFIIVMDDFFVPRRSNRAHPHGDFGFDFYNGKILDWGYIRDLFSDTDIKIYYPLRPNRDRRGFVLLLAGYDSEKLGFLKNLPFECIDKNDPIHKDPTKLSPLAYFDFRYLLRRIIPLPLLRGAIRIFQKMIC